NAGKAAGGLGIMKRINIRNYPFRLRLHLLPVLVWLGTVACVIGLFTRRVQRFEVIGMARGQVRQIAATCTGKLTEVRVNLFEQIKAGQTLAVIDTILDNEQVVEAELKTQLNAAIAEIEHLTSQLVPTQEALMAEKADREINHATEMRRYFVDADQARLQILTLKAQIASDSVLLADLEAEVKISEALLKEEAIAPYELQKAKVQYDSLAKKVEENQRMLEQAERDLESAKQRLDEFSRLQLTHPSVNSTLEVIRKEAAVQEKLMDGLLKQLEALGSRRTVELKAPFDGVVIPIQGQANQTILRRPGEDVIRRAGEVVRAGDSILAVAELRPSEIIAYVSESQLRIVREKTPVEIVKNSPPEQKARCEVTYIGPTMELMPERLWLNPTIPQWGRPVVIKIPQGMELISGELVGIRNL
ncbi:MAG: HlyD family efflux transporter periplasmic adaptor subunit, partial [Sedimentisphaerales bacterium]|nr:HlyD family efflux transporter periplasmic adaptor subunit [Sedimentisphaerales bacterium]